jgi:hypothetical protein
VYGCVRITLNCFLRKWKVIKNVLIELIAIASHSDISNIVKIYANVKVIYTPSISQI